MESYISLEGKNKMEFIKAKLTECNVNAELNGILLELMDYPNPVKYRQYINLFVSMCPNFDSVTQIAFRKINSILSEIISPVEIKA